MIKIIGSYFDFLKSKEFISKSYGHDILESEMNDTLYDFQKAIVRWAIGKGKSCYKQAVANMMIAEKEKSEEFLIFK